VRRSSTYQSDKIQNISKQPTQMKGDLIRFKTAQDTCLNSSILLENGKK
jgi:hypothetical protein